MTTKTALLSVLAACSASAFAAGAMQTFRPSPLVRGDVNIRPVQEFDGAAWIWADVPTQWGAAAVSHWARLHRDLSKPQFFRFRRRFTASGAKAKIDVSADERFILLLDGREIARGPHRGMPDRWFYATYELDLALGEHVLEAVAWQFGAHAPYAQLSWRGGFALKAAGEYDALLTTGKAAWEVAELFNTKLTGQGDSAAWGVGSETVSRGCSFLGEEPKEWKKPVVVRDARDKPNEVGVRLPGWLAYPTAIPDQLSAVRRPGEFKAAHDGLAELRYAAADAKHPAVVSLNALLREGCAFTVPANSELRAVWDLGDYYCAYPELTLSGGAGAEVRWEWNESLRDAKGMKGDRAAFAGKDFGRAFGDRFVCDGRNRAEFTAPWWRCGRWCQFEIKTGAEPLTFVSLSVRETRYPTESTARFECDDPSIASVRRICTRAQQMCSHEMFFDCPYFEQQMYPGDSRVQFLVTAAMHADPRLVRQALSIFAEAQRSNGFMPMNFPTCALQESCTYTMCWIYMLRDWMWWRTDADALKAWLPNMRRAISGLERCETAEGFIGRMPGWSFVDYTPNWYNGLPPRGKADDLSAAENLQYLYAIRCAAEVERTVGLVPLAGVYSAKADALAAKIRAKFWCAEREMLSDVSEKTIFSEQVQSLAVVAGVLTPEEGRGALLAVFAGKDVTPVTVYFSHYLFDACFKCGLADEFFRRLDLWRSYVAANMSTLQEMPPHGGRDPRSDCHAWGAHPLYHLQAHVAGVKPSKPFFAEVRVAPQPGPLKFVKAATPTPHGLVEEYLKFADGKVCGTVTLPTGLFGKFAWNGAEIRLVPGANAIDR